jgi:hypothetical protein
MQLNLERKPVDSCVYYKAIHIGQAHTESNIWQRSEYADGFATIKLRLQILTKPFIHYIIDDNVMHTNCFDEILII